MPELLHIIVEIDSIHRGCHKLAVPTIHSRIYTFRTWPERGRGRGASAPAHPHARRLLIVSCHATPLLDDTERPDDGSSYLFSARPAARADLPSPSPSRHPGSAGTSPSSAFLPMPRSPQVLLHITIRRFVRSDGGHGGDDPTCRPSRSCRWPCRSACWPRSCCGAYPIDAWFACICTWYAGNKIATWSTQPAAIRTTMIQVVQHFYISIYSTMPACQWDHPIAVFVSQSIKQEGCHLQLQKKM